MHKRSIVLITFIYIPFFLFGQCLSGTYTIGGTNPNYATFNSAVNALVVNGVCGPVVFRVRDGVYNEQISIPSIVGASSQNTIKFEGENGAISIARVQYSASNSINQNYTIDLNGADYIGFKNLEFARTGLGSYSDVLYIHNGAAYNILDSNLIESSYSSNTISSTLIASDGTLDNYNSFTNNTFIGGVIGIYARGTSQSQAEHGLIISGNSFTNQDRISILFSKQQDLTIDKNVFSYTGYNSQHASIFIDSCYVNLILTSNKISQSIGTAIYLSRSNWTSGSGALVANNFIITSNSSTFGSAQCVNIYNCSTINFYFNSLYVAGVNTSGVTLLNCSFISLKNNIIFGANTGIESSNSTSNFSSNYNDIYPANFKWNSTTLNTITSWTTASGEDLNSISVDPLYASSNDLHVVNNIDIDNKGTFISSVLTDIDGQPRNSLPDIGADEFNSPPDNASIISSNLVFPVCPGTNQILITLKNQGSNSLTNLKLNWKVNNINQPSIQWNGSLLPGASSSIIIGNYIFTSNRIQDIKVWSELPNGNPDTQPSNDTLRLSGNTMLSGIYTIGGYQPDFPTFSDAVSALSSNGVCGPVTMNVRDGIYSEAITIGEVMGASPINRITFQSENHDSTVVIIDFTTGGSYFSPAYSTLLFDHAKYITFRRMTIQRSGTYPGSITVVGFNNGSSNNVLENNILRTTLTLQPQSLTSPSAVILITSNNLLSNDSNTIQNNLIENGSYGIYLMRSLVIAPDNKWLIQNNTFLNQFESCILIQNNDSIKILNNKIFSNRSTLTTGTFEGINLTKCQAFNISRNTLSYNSGWGISLNSCQNNTSLSGIVANNFISCKEIGLVISYSQNTKIAYNSILVNGNASSSYLIHSAGASAVSLLNNILVSANNGAIFNTNPIGVSSNYNDFYTTGNITTGYSSLSSWQSTGNDLNSINVLPGFLSNTDLHITGGNPLLRIATPIPGVYKDIDNDTRNQTIPCIGADEFISTPRFDVGIVTINQPTINSCHGSPDVKVNVTNYNITDTIKSFFVFFEVNGLVVDTFLWQGLLLPGDTARNILISHYYFQYGNPYQLRIWTALPNYSMDLDNSNDTLQISNPFISMGGTYTIGGINPDFSSFEEANIALQNLGICDSTVFYVRPGLYSESLLFGNISGSSTSNTITFISELNDSNSVILRPFQYDQIVINLNNARNYRFRQLKIDQIYPATYSMPDLPAVKVNNSNNCFFENNSIIGNINSSSVDKIMFSNNFIYQGHLKISLSGLNNKVIGNSFYNELVDTIINLIGQTDPYIGFNNIIPLNHFGVFLNFETCTKGKIEKNKFHSLTAYGGILSESIRISNSNGTATYPIEVINNMIVHKDINVPVIFSSIGIVCFNSSYVNIYHNTILLDKSTSSTSHSTCFKLYGSNFINVVGNIFQLKLDSNSIIYNYTIQIDNPNSLGQCDYNLYSECSSFARTSSSTNLIDFSNWQSFSGKDQNSLCNVFPQYIPDSTFSQYQSLTLAVGSPALYSYTFPFLSPNNPNPYRSGIYLPSLVTDIQGELRNVFNPMIGADEYGLLLNDAGAAAFDSSIYYQCVGTNPVPVIIANYGLQQLTSLIINWSLDGIAQPTYYWTGNLNSGDSLLVNIGNYILQAMDSVEIHAWTSMPNGVSDSNFVYDTAVAIVRTALAGSYTIGGNTPDFVSFSQAIQALTQQGVCSSVIFNVRNGIYSESIVIPYVAGSSAINTITFQSESLDSTSVILEYGYTSPVTNYVVYLDNASYIHINKITIRNTTPVLGNDYRRVLFLKGAIHNFKLTNSILETSFYPYGSANCAIVEGDLIYSDSNYSESIISNNIIKNGSSGIYYNINSSSIHPDRLKILNNHIKGQVGTCINLTNLNSPIVHSNSIEIDTILGVLTGGIALQTCNDSFQITNNKIYNLSAYGIDLWDCNGVILDKGLIANNSIEINFPLYSYSTGISINLSSNIRIIHNSVLINDQSQDNTHSALTVMNSSSLEMKNNNIMMNGSGASVDYNTVSSIVSDYNNFYSSSGILGRYNSLTNINDITAWQLQTSQDFNSLSIDPYFIFPYSLRFNQIFLNNAGIFVNDINTDIEGVVRNSTSPDIGCYEQNFYLPSIDAQPSLVYLSSSTPMCPDSSAILCDIKNLSDSILYGLRINWIINSILQPQIIWTDTLQPYATETNILLGNNYFQTGVNAIKVWTDNPNLQPDINTSNDTIFYNFFVYPDVSVSLGQDTSLCTNNTFILDAGLFSSYYWSTGDTSQTVALSSTGSYNVIVTDSNGCMGSDTFVLTINAIPPTPIINLIGDTLLSNSSAGNQWNLNGIPIAGAIGSNYVPSQSGLYSVTVTNSSGCSSESAAYNYIVGFYELNHNNKVTLMPNPTSGLISMELHNVYFTDITVQIYTTLGEKLSTIELKNVSGFARNAIDLSKFSNGIYIAEIYFSDGEKIITKLVKN